jgi:hypothetical protein
VANDVMGMLSLSAELASPILVGPNAAEAVQIKTGTDAAGTHTRTHIAADINTHTSITIGNQLQPLGRFLLPDQERAKSLYRLAP